MSMTLAVLLAIPAAQWTPTHEAGGCTFYKAPTIEGYAPVRATCIWPTSAAALARLAGRFDLHDEIFENITTSERIEARPAGGDIYRQIVHTFGMSDREAIARMWSEALPGGSRHAWETVDRPDLLTGKNMSPLADVGCWDIEPLADGTTRATYYEYYSPGGQIPSFVIDFFMGRGLEKVALELRSAAELQ